jgi:hypothetical protein
MNIFYLDSDIDTCAEMHCDKHVVKMVLEYAQLLSTAHRVLDGIEYIEIQNNRRVVRWRLSDLSMESMIYKATHINHPSAVWVRSSIDHYNWLSGLLSQLLKEYTHRYNKIHKIESIGLNDLLKVVPKNISVLGWIDPPQAMPDDSKRSTSVEAYRNYYCHYKAAFAKWTKRSIPDWWVRLTDKRSGSG